MVKFSPFKWDCPHCYTKQTVTSEEYHHSVAHINIKDHTLYPLGYQVYAVGCANSECRKVTVTFQLNEDAGETGRWRPIDSQEAIIVRRIIPESSAEVQPDYIPAPLREDYNEACNIRDLSPKAAATLARRCLQGMIRDFCGIKKSRLIDEITALRKAVEDGTAPRSVTSESVDAIDHVRDVGNIGAHMEKEIDLIISVDPGEAQILIELIESLFEDWYVARDRRGKRFGAVKELAHDKKALIADGRERRAQSLEIRMDKTLLEFDTDEPDPIK